MDDDYSNDCLSSLTHVCELNKTCAVGLLAISLLAACGSGNPVATATQSPTQSPKSAATCPPPSPGPTPIAAWLAYPLNGSTNVATNVGEIIEKGASTPGEGVTITISSSAGSVLLGTPAVAPSPYPTPFATTPPTFALSNLPYMAIPLPTLSPATAYTVNDVYTDWANNPPQCTAQYSQFVGTFTTR